MDYRERNERAQAILRGEPVPPEYVAPRVLVFDGDALCCSFCSATDIELRGAAVRPEIEPDDVAMLFRCHACGTDFSVIVVKALGGVVVEVAEVE